jgi:ferrous iron transport protein B
MQSFTWQLTLVEEGAEHTSILASIASPLAVVLIPVCGVAAWQLMAAVVTGFIAKENVVGTLAVTYAITNFIDVDELVMTGGANEVAMAMGLTKAAALAYLMLNLFTPPCFAALGAMNSEMQDAKWFWGGVALQIATGYSVAFVTYQLGTLIVSLKNGTGFALGAGFVPGLIAVLVMATIIVAVGVYNNKKKTV